MKKMKRFLAFLLCLMLAFQACCLTSFAKKDDDDDEDYSVSDVGFDVSDESIYIYWTVGDSKCSYKVELFKSSNMINKNRVGDVMSAGYTAEKIDVTQRILNKGSGTYYAKVTCKSKPKGEDSYEYAIGSESISSDDISLIKATRKAKAATTAASNPTSGTGGVTGTAGGPGVGAGGSANPTAADASTALSWQALENNQWAAVKPDGTRVTGWYQMKDVWYFSGDDGIMKASAWIPSAAEAGVWFYVDASGAMLTNADTPDGYHVDAEGKWRS